MVIRRVVPNERNEVTSLVHRVFMEYEAPDYTKEGIDAFHETGIYNSEYMNTLEILGAFEEDIMVGVIATRCNGSHIALFFVDGNFQSRGIGKALFNAVVKEYHGDKITVNSSPYAKKIYHHLGFKETNKLQTITGIKFIPMEFINCYKKEM